MVVSAVLIILRFLNLNYVYPCKSVLGFVHVSAGAVGRQRRAPDLQELELQVILSCLT